ncbi:MAG: hypothetical protein K2X48_13480 [Chitinophagaceae bacterium]|nr:hypothetical protein [Chitinophagaceae bacterium]
MHKLSLRNKCFIRMHQTAILQKFEYSIPATIYKMWGANEEYFPAQYQPLMSVRIDFVKGLLLEGNWQFMVKANKHNADKWITSHRGRVQMDLSFSSSFAVELNNQTDEGFVFPMDGYLNDFQSLTELTGLLIIEKCSRTSGVITNQWNVSFYWYDCGFDVCEIKFCLPVYVNDMVDETNN